MAFASPSCSHHVVTGGCCAARHRLHHQEEEGGGKGRRKCVARVVPTGEAHVCEDFPQEGKTPAQEAIVQLEELGNLCATYAASGQRQRHSPRPSGWKGGHCVAVSPAWVSSPRGPWSPPRGIVPDRPPCLHGPSIPHHSGLTVHFSVCHQSPCYPTTLQHRDPSVLPTVHPQQGWGPWEPQPQPSPVGSSAAQDTLEHDQVLLLRVPRGLGPLLCKAGGNLRGPPGGLTCTEGARPAARHAVRQRLSRGLCPGQECRGQLATCLS